MRFGPVRIEEAEGAVLAHSIGLPGGALKKGRPLSRDDLGRLAAAGHATVVAARLEADDVAEDQAAERVARVLGGDGIVVARPFTGRANLFAAAAGLLRFDPAALAALNRIDERVTVASLAADERVEARQMVATVKIIPFAAPASVVAAAEATAAAARLTVAPFRPLGVGLVLTRLAATKPTVIEKRTRVISDRLGALGCSIAQTRVVEHETGAVAAALGDLGRAGHPLLLVFAASAIVDREDVVPAGLVAAGGAIERLGMPVDPGNLLLMGRLGPTPVVGIPSCAASPKLNGFDWVLERLAAGISVSSADIAVMGVGGLLKEIASRPQPRDPAASHVAPRHRPIIGAVVLAAGRSTRMGSNKLLEIVGGKPIVRHVVEAIRASSVASVHVVVGHMEDAVRTALDGLDVAFVANRRFAEGLSTSVKTGIDALPAGVEGALVALGDMPEIGGGEIDRLIAAFAPADNRSIVVPTWRGKRGNPVLWAAQYFPELRALSGDSGAKHLLGIHAEAVAEVEWAGPAAVTDIDTPEALAALRNRVAAP